MLREKGKSVRIDMYNGQVTAATNLSLAIEDKMQEVKTFFWNLEGDLSISGPFYKSDGTIEEKI